MEKKRYRNDAILIGVFVILALIFAMIPFFHTPVYGGVLEITCNGSTLATFTLDHDSVIDLLPFEEKIRTYSEDELPALDTLKEGCYNRVCIKNGAVYIEAANCKTNDCMRQGSINKDGQAIVCLPHKLVLTIHNNYKLTDEDAVTW